MKLDEGLESRIVFRGSSSTTNFRLPAGLKERNETGKPVPCKSRCPIVFRVKSSSCDGHFSKLLGFDAKLYTKNQPKSYQYEHFSFDSKLNKKPIVSSCMFLEYLGVSALRKERVRGWES